MKNEKIDKNRRSELLIEKKAYDSMLKELGEEKLEELLSEFDVKIKDFREARQDGWSSIKKEKSQGFDELFAPPTLQEAEMIKYFFPRGCNFFWDSRRPTMDIATLILYRRNVSIEQVCLGCLNKDCVIRKKECGV